jgi:hypothetical protein
MKAREQDMLILIPKTAVPQVWGLASPYLDRAVKAGSTQSTDEWLMDCINAQKQLWLVWSQGDTCEGAGVTGLIETPQGKTCIIYGFGAKTGSDWMSTLPVLEDWAKSEDCARVRVYGRVGWTEKLKDYALKGVILDRTL